MGISCHEEVMAARLALKIEHQVSIEAIRFGLGSNGLLAMIAAMVLARASYREFTPCVRPGCRDCERELADIGPFEWKARAAAMLSVAVPMIELEMTQSKGSA